MTPLRLKSDNYSFNMWGGNWIPALKKLPASKEPVGEAWEFSCHPLRPSSVTTPEGALPLPALLEKFGEPVMGAAALARFGATSPFLVKLIDSHDDLSVQVHPDDEKAAQLSEESGKSESWIVLETEPGPDNGFIYLGFNKDRAAGFANADVFSEAFLEALNQANSQGPSENAAVREKAQRLVLPFLNKIRVRAGDSFNVPPGTVHAIGRGVRLYEIQQTSDVTYRVWDWNRPDTAKKAKGILEFRPLHLEKAKKSLDFVPHDPAYYQITPRRISGSNGVVEEALIDEKDGRFAANRIVFEAKGATQKQSLKSFHVLTVSAGAVSVSNGSPVPAGHSILVPASLGSYDLSAAEPGTVVIKSFIPG